jgi:thiol-disulfide isomerase/thioredoxin
MNLRLLPAVALAFSLGASAFAKTGWVDDFEKGLAKAKAENKPALVDFTGSDWCVWCKRLDEEIFSKKQFKEYVKDKYVLIEVDFPQIKRLPRRSRRPTRRWERSTRCRVSPQWSSLARTETRSAGWVMSTAALTLLSPNSRRRRRSDVRPGRQFPISFFD